MKRFVFSVLPGLLLPLLASAQEGVLTTPEDRALAQTVMTELSALDAGLSRQELVLEAALRLEGEPYVEGTLDGPGEETMQVYLTRTDCILLVETALGLAVTARESGPDFERLCANLSRTRYRDGIPDGYGSRLHYSSEWISHGEALGLLTEATGSLGGEIQDHPLFFMSRNYQKYNKLKNADTDPSEARELARIRAAEEALSARKTCLIPKDRMALAEPLLRPGDLLFFTASAEGLDIVHVAIFCPRDGKPGFLHASSKAGKVVWDARSPSEYAASRRAVSGLRVVRVKD